jgi:hypothetical protein
LPVLFFAIYKKHFSIAIQVKINDLLDNMNITRSRKEINELDLKRLNKYLKAFWKLQKKFAN